jgi:hypothetical protein
MDNKGRVILLEVIGSGGQPISGLVWDGDGVAHAFSGWPDRSRRFRSWPSRKANM